MGDVLRTALLALSGLLLPAVAVASECAESTNTSDLTSALERAEGAYGDLDVASFRDAMDEAQTTLICLDQELTQHLAAELHRMEGLRAFIDRDSGKAVTAFAAARSLEPHYRFPSTLVPEGNPVHDDYTALDPRSSKTTRLPDPRGARLVIDGRSSNERSASFPTAFQLVLDNGRVTNSSYLWPEDPVPLYEKSPTQVGVAPVSPVPGGGSGSGGAAAAVRTGPDKGLMIGAGGALAASALLYGGAFMVHRNYDDPNTDIDRLNGIRGTNNMLVLASGASAVTAVGLGTTAFLVARF